METSRIRQILSFQVKALEILDSNKRLTLNRVMVLA